MITIDMRQAMTVTVPDSAGIDHEHNLVEGLNDVPPEVAAHWYVQKFTRPVRRVPRTAVPSAARPVELPPATIAAMAEALAPVAAAAAAEPAPDSRQTADVPAAREKGEKVKT